jgi:uncharacterized membrane protein
MINRSSDGHYSGERRDSLLPPVEVLERYEELQGGRDLINLVKIEQEHRHRLQNKYSNSHRLGQVLSFIVTVYFIYEIFALIKLDYIKEAYIVSGIFSSMVLGVALVLKANRSGMFARKKLTESFASKRLPQRKSG